MKTVADLSFEEFKKIPVALIYPDRIIFSYGKIEYDEETKEAIGIHQYGKDPYWVVQICQHWYKTNHLDEAIRLWYEYLKGEEHPLK